MLGRAFLAMMLAIAPATAADLTVRSAPAADYTPIPSDTDRPAGVRHGNQGCCAWHEGIRLCERETGRVICHDGWTQSRCDC